MTRAIRVRAGRITSGDAGIALVGVMGLMAMVTVLLLGTLAYTVQNLRPTRSDEDAKTAVAAAQAGIDDYVARLNANPDYWKYVVTNPATEPNKALTSGGRPVPGTSGTAATFRYQVLTTAADVAAGGVIRLQSTGTSGPKNRSVSRTLTANLQPGSFLNYIYHTDLEDLDPVLWTTNTTQIANCSKYWWAGRSSASCSEISFAASDVINGPLHSNDAMAVGTTTPAVTFANAQTTTSYAPASGNPWRGTATPRGYAPRYRSIVQIPSSNDELKKVASDPTRGCVYTGATKITFSGTLMSVLSPNTKTGPASCYNTSTVTARNSPQTVAIPKVIYVDDYAGSCGNGGTAKKTGLSTSSTPGYPITNEYVGNGDRVASGAYQGPVYDCTDGTAYVGGMVDTAVTLGSAQDVVVTGDLTYQDGSAGSTDVLGLVPGHFAWVHHPVSQSGSSPNFTYSNLLATPVTRIDAAILTVKDSFIVQNWNLAPALGTTTTNLLNVNGAIAQKFRGTVASQASADGSVAHGYVKNYIYDERFQRGVQPPYFLKPVSAPWEVRRVSDSPVPPTTP